MLRPNRKKKKAEAWLGDDIALAPQLRAFLYRLLMEVPKLRSVSYSFYVKMFFSNCSGFYMFTLLLVWFLLHEDPEDLL
jgi:hypothetical protein